LAAIGDDLSLLVDGRRIFEDPRFLRLSRLICGKVLLFLRPDQHVRGYAAVFFVDKKDGGIAAKYDWLTIGKAQLFRK
jgi:hypothetical protein